MFILQFLVSLLVRRSCRMNRTKKSAMREKTENINVSASKCDDESEKEINVKQKIFIQTAKTIK